MAATLPKSEVAQETHISGLKNNIKVLEAWG